jgi:MOSC domain-containing protein YiiM
MCDGRIIQINRSNGGLPKHRFEGLVSLTSEGIEGDRHLNLKYHGGPNKAVLMIAAETLDELAASGFPVNYGDLGENLTVRGLDRSLWRTGQRYRIGDGALIELTTLRVPCDNLLRYSAPGNRPISRELYDAKCKAGDHSSPNWARGGFYGRVIRDGLLTAGAPIVLESDIA